MFDVEEKRDQVVALRFSTDELDQIDSQAAREGRDRSNLIRWAVARYLEAQTQKEPT